VKCTFTCPNNNEDCKGKEGCPGDCEKCEKVCDCKCNCPPPIFKESDTWTGRLPVQGGNNGRIVVTINGVAFQITVSGQQAGTRNHNVEGYIIRVTTNDNNYVTAVSVTSTAEEINEDVVINSVVSLTPGTGNSQT